MDSRRIRRATTATVAALIFTLVGLGVAHPAVLQAPTDRIQLDDTITITITQEVPQ